MSSGIDVQTAKLKRAPVFVALPITRRFERDIAAQRERACRRALGSLAVG